MTVLMIGGLLDGELREVPDGKWRVDAYEHHGLDQPHTITRYHIANGIARHESVSEEEVARLVRRWMLASTRVVSNPSPIPSWVRNKIDENDSAEFYRR